MVFLEVDIQCIHGNNRPRWGGGGGGGGGGGTLVTYFAEEGVFF